MKSPCFWQDPRFPCVIIFTLHEPLHSWENHCADIIRTPDFYTKRSPYTRTAKEISLWEIFQQIKNPSIRIERIFFFDHYVNHASRSARQYPARHTDPSDQAVPAFHRYAFTLTALHKVPAADSNQYPRLLLISLPDLRCSCDVLSARHRCLQVCRSSS